MRLILLCLLPFLFACNSSTTKLDDQKVVMADTLSKSDSQLDTIVYNNEDTLVGNESITSQTATYFVVIVDTSKNYFLLREKMFRLNKLAGLKIDTMSRYYDVKKPGIILPLDSDDEIYAGEYYPRRYPSSFLSLEHFGFYYSLTNENTMALVAGICETKVSADSTMLKIKQYEKGAFVLKSDIYMGCMH